MTRVPNPVLPGCFPDPSVCRAGEWTYLVTSTFEYLPGLPVLRSRDLATWEHVGHVVDRPSQVEALGYDGVASSGGLYAPTIRYHDGTFWVVCTMVDPDDATRGGNFLMTATDPAGPWSDPVWLDVDGIDPSLLFDDDGRVWAHGTRLATEPLWYHQTEVWVRELDPVTKTLVGPEHVVWHGAVEGVVWAEGPHLYRVDDGYLLVAAEGGTEIHHAVSVARADTVTGPYTGSKANPVLTHRNRGRTADVVGVGHADLVELADGSWWAVLLGMRTSGGYHYPLGRETFLVPVEWEDGWPLLAPRTGCVPAEVDVPGDGPWEPGLVQGRTSGVVPPQDPRWTAVRDLPSRVAVPAGAGWDLPLRPAGLADVDVPALLGLRLQHLDTDLRARLTAPLAPGEEVGLVLRQSERHHVRLAVTVDDGGTWRAAVVHRHGEEETAQPAVVLDVAPGAVPDLVLTAQVRGVDVVLRAGIDGVDGADGAEGVQVGTADLRSLDSVTTGGFLGVWLGVHGTSHGRPTSTVARVTGVEYLPAG